MKEEKIIVKKEEDDADFLLHNDDSEDEVPLNIEKLPSKDKCLLPLTNSLILFRDIAAWPLRFLVDTHRWNQCSKKDDPLTLMISRRRFFAQAASLTLSAGAIVGCLALGILTGGIGWVALAGVYASIGILMKISRTVSSHSVQKLKKEGTPFPDAPSKIKLFNSQKKTSDSKLVDSSKFLPPSSRC